MRLSRSVAVVLLTPLLLSACITGKRPSFGTNSDPAIAAVLNKLDIATTGPFTASYSVLSKLGNVTTPATVAIDTADGRSVTIGAVRFLLGPDGLQTCNLSTTACVPQLDDAQISDKALTHDFYGASPAARIRQDATTMVGPAIGSTEPIAGQNATCVQLSFTSGSKKYCTLDNGVLAFQDTPDLLINLLSIVDSSDPQQFTASTLAP